MKSSESPQARKQAMILQTKQTRVVTGITGIIPSVSLALFTKDIDQSKII